MPVTESRKAVAVQNCTQLDDPGLNFYFHHNKLMLTKLYNCPRFNFILEFCSFILYFILVFIVVVVLLEKVRLINFYS